MWSRRVLSFVWSSFSSSFGSIILGVFSREVPCNVLSFLPLVLDSSPCLSLVGRTVV